METSLDKLIRFQKATIKDARLQGLSTSVKINETILEIIRTLHKYMREDEVMREFALDKVEDLASQLFAKELEKN